MIGIYDSGMGGITVLAHLLKRLPHENYFYLADYLYAPYGEKDKQELSNIINQNISFLIEKGCNTIVIACNTASTFAKELREKYSVPIIAIEPGIKMVHDFKEGTKTLVLATPYTLQSEKFTNLFRKFGNSSMQLLPCKGLSSLIEKGNDREIMDYLHKLLLPYQDCQNIVLGCTHYPLIKDKIKKVLPHTHIAFFDGGDGVSKEVERIRKRQGSLSEPEGAVTFFFTDQMDRTASFQQALDDYIKQEKICYNKSEVKIHE